MQARSRSSRFSELPPRIGHLPRSESGLRGAAPRRTACACRRGPRGEQRGPNVGPVAAGRGSAGARTDLRSDYTRPPPSAQATADRVDRPEPRRLA